MLLGGDLGFLCSLVVVVVGWFLARRKWRRVAARREEIKRLMAFASEETARVELEATAGYVSYGSPPPAAAEELVVRFGSSTGRQLQYQCEVCFSPTTTRCKQCKAVHYCSRKCQIFHWRQGHKDECHSFITHRNMDAGSNCCLAESKQDEIQSGQNVIGVEMAHATKSVESSSGECRFPNPILASSGKNDVETDNSDNGKGSDINVNASVESLHDECSSSATSDEMSVASDSNLKDHSSYDGQSTSINVESTKPLLSELPSLANPECHEAGSTVLNEFSSGCISTDEKSESTTLSGSTSSVSEEHSFSVPSTPSDFWEGTVEPIRSKIDALDEFGDADMFSSRPSSLLSSGKINSRVELLGSDMKRVSADDRCPLKSTPKKETATPEVSEDGLNPREPLSVSCKPSNQNGVSNTSTECSSKVEAKLSPSRSSRDHIPEGHLSNKHDVDVRLQSLAPEHLDCEIGGTNGILNTMKCPAKDSLKLRSSEARLSSSSCSRKPELLNAACSLDSSRYVRSTMNGTSPSGRTPMDQLRVPNFIMNGSLGAGNGTLGRYEGSFSYDLFVKLYNWNKVELCPCGLINCGNSCYANAVLQCLAFTPPLTAYFLQGFHAKACRKKEWCFTCDFEALVKKAKEGCSPLSPAQILSQMQHQGSHLGNGREEDAHEFLRCAIDAMQLVCLNKAGVKVPSSLDEETTLLGLTFGGYLESKIECMRCWGKSKQHERIMDLTVEIGGEIGSLEDALRQFTRSEILDGENKYHCARCKSYERAKKKLRVLEAPNILTIALKRFQSGKFGKLNKAVKFPDILNLAPYMSGTSDKSPIYQLYGVVVHLDVMNATFSGHYVCYVKNNHGRWFKADDSTVKEVELENVLSKDAYMLFYARCSPRAPRLIRSSMGPRVKNLSGKFKSHPSDLWDVKSSGHNTSNAYSYRSHTSRHPCMSRMEEDDICSEYSSSFFSDAGSHSTESSNRESTSTDDSFDQIFGDMENCSDTPSPTSSSSSSSSSVNVNCNGDGIWARETSKGRGTFLSNKECSVGSSHSSNRRNESSNRLGSNKSLDNVKGVYLRSMT